MAIIQKDSKISINFSLKLEDNQMIDSNFGQSPVEFQMGDGSLLPGFETVLLGLESGFEGSFEIEPDVAFGQPNPGNVQPIERKMFAPDQQLERGLVLNFDNGAAGELPGVILAVNDDEVLVDFNHPLAGKTIIFQVKISDVKG